MQRGSNYMSIGDIPQRTVNVAQLSCNATKTLSDTPINVQLTSYDNMFNDNTFSFLHNAATHIAKNVQNIVFLRT